MDALSLYMKLRLEIGLAIAADGKRTRSDKRSSEDHYVTVALVEHSSCNPAAALGYREEGGEFAAVEAASQPSTPAHR